MSEIDTVLAANAAFYDAFLRRDLRAMERLWARNAPAACIHPGWPALYGREAVLASWAEILANPGAPAIRCAEPRVSLLGEAAFVVCHEVIGNGRLVATNVFVREEGEWRMVHHQAGPFRAPSAAPARPPKAQVH